MSICPSLPVPQDTALLASFSHSAGYDAGFYGYAWADAIAADMATVFETARGRYFDQDAGLRLRRETYEPGDSRDVNISIEKFLGRRRSLEPLLRQLGGARRTANSRRRDSARHATRPNTPPTPSSSSEPEAGEEPRTQPLPPKIGGHDLPARLDLHPTLAGIASLAALRRLSTSASGSAERTT